MSSLHIAAGLYLATVLSLTAATPFDEAFDHMYNFDFPGAHGILDGYIAAHPAEPLPYAMRGACYLFRELDRLGILEAQFFADDKRIIDKKKLTPDPAIRARFLAAVNDAQSRANAILANDPDDRDALFALAITQGVVTDYMALVEKRQIASLTPARLSNSYAQRLLRLDSSYYDAYLTTGVSEYIVGSLPFFVRWFVRFDNISGSKEKGVHNVAIVARQGRYLRPFAKILLAIACLRDKDLAGSRRMLSELNQEFPANPLFRKELAKLDSRIGAAAN